MHACLLAQGFTKIWSVHQWGWDMYSTLKDFRKDCCNEMFSFLQQQLTGNMVNDPKTWTSASRPGTRSPNKNHPIWERGFSRQDASKDQWTAALQRRYADYRASQDKINGVNIIVKNDEVAEYLYLSKCKQHVYRKLKITVWLARYKGSTLFSDGYMPNTIGTYNF